MQSPKVTAEEIIAAYRETGSVWKAAKKVGLCGQSVWERLTRLGYRLPGSQWTEEENAALREMAGRASMADIAKALGRPYASVASRLSALGISGRVPKVRGDGLRGTGLTKSVTTQLAKELATFNGRLTHFCKQRGLKVDIVVKALQKHTPAFWAEYSRTASGLAEATCEYCRQPFYPLNKKQRTCTRKCQAHLRSDRQYFNGQRRNTIGMAEGVCQVCERERKSLHSHHVWGKEHDPDATFLIAVCAGCHELIGRLASMTICGDPEFFERLLIFAKMRRDGARRPLGFHCYVEFDELTQDEIDAEHESADEADVAHEAEMAEGAAVGSGGA